MYLNEKKSIYEDFFEVKLEKHELYVIFSVPGVTHKCFVHGICT
jgi:hypothetical protein